MKQLIIVRFLPPTNTKPARLKAFNTGKTHSITEANNSNYMFQKDGWEYSQHHVLACRLCNELGWEHPTGCGVNDNGEVVFTFTLIQTKHNV